MTIKEVSALFGVSQDTLRYYERMGMIPPVGKTEAGIRDYTEEDRRWIGLALCLKGSGLPGEVIARYVSLFRQGDETIGERLELLREQRNVLMEKRRRIDEAIGNIEHKIERYEEALETGELSWDRR